MTVDELTFTGHLISTTCWCGIRVGIPDQLYRWAKLDAKNGIHCPLGHRFVYRETEADALRAKLDQAEADARWQRSEAERARERARREEAMAKAATAEAKRTRQRAAGGACPCCNRSFVQLARHMATKHPDFIGADVIPDDLTRLTLRDAALAVVNAAGEPLTTSQVFGRLVLAGRRRDVERSVGMTLYNLAKFGHIVKTAPATFGRA